jgi:HptB-dependent secretion and biofilm anti anti-sigma factor
MDVTQSVNAGNADVFFKGKFTFADNVRFRQLVDEMKTNSIKNLVIDLGGVEFIDSAALGMLLIARDEAQKQNIQLTLRNPTGQLKKMFAVSKFDSLFNIIN